jgi:magnesium transporter
VNVQARLFDADRPDRVLEAGALEGLRLGKRQLLWLDFAVEPAVPGAPAAAELAAILKPFALKASTLDRLARPRTRPRLELHGEYFVLSVAVLAGAEGEARGSWLDLVAGRNFVLTLHQGALAFLGELDTSIELDTPVGELDAPSFSAVLLDALLTSYLGVVDDFEGSIDHLDGLALRGTRRDLLGELVRLRRGIAAVRRTLIAQRPIFAALARADFEAVALAGPTAAGRFRTLEGRFEGALAAIEGARDLMLGTFEIHMSRTAQRTNEIMKVLTLTSVLLLPGALIAGVMGMNFKVPLFDDAGNFYLIVGAIALIALLTALGARLRGWL